MGTELPRRLSQLLVNIREGIKFLVVNGNSRLCNIWANVSAVFMLAGVVIAIATTIWQPRGLLICFVPFAVAFVAKQGEARALRSALRSKMGSISSVDTR